MTDTSTEAVERVAKKLEAAYEWVTSKTLGSGTSYRELISWFVNRPIAAIFAACVTLRALAAERDALRALVEKYEARLEIDHIFKFKGGILVRVDVPPEKRGSMPDAVTCRDAKIELLEGALAKKNAKITRLKAKLAEGER